ncbi:MAG: hypothetical protein ACRERX_21595 [Pseudomonas sp.]
MGASRWRIVTVVLIENLALAAAAATKPQTSTTALPASRPSRWRCVAR